MARTKTKYREFRDGGRVDSIGQDELPVEPPAEAVTAPAEPQPAAPEPLIPPPEAIPALKAQLEALKASESLQQQQQTIADTEARRGAWVRANPLAQKHYDRLGEFHSEAIRAGLADTSLPYFQHMESRLAALQAQTPPVEESKMPAPRVFTAPPAAGPSLGASSYSAPVSRDIPGGNGRRQPGKITLTRAEVEAAATAGITVEEYAQQKAKYQNMLATGEYRDNRDTR